MSAPAAPNTFFLLSLPDELLPECLPEYVKPGVCRKLLDLQASRGLRLRLHLKQAGDGGDEPARKTLQQLVQLCPALRKLAVEISGAVESDTLSTFLTPPPMHEPAWLANLVDITIGPGMDFEAADWEGQVHFNSFIPGCLADACPLLERLVLKHIYCQQQLAPEQQQEPSCQEQQPQQQQQQWQPAILPHLRELVLDHCTIIMDYEAVQQQLEALPSLKEFKILAATPEGSDRFCSKVRDMEWSCCGDGNFSKFRGPWPKLRTLEACPADIDDDELEAVSNTMPSLEQLGVCTFCLSKPCSKPLPCLSTVLFSGLSLGWGCLKSLRHLALSCTNPLRLLTFSDEYIGVDLSDCGGDSTAEEDLEMAASVASVLQQVGGVREDGQPSGHGLFFMCNHQPPHAQQVLHKLLVVIHGLRDLTLVGNIHISTELLAAVGHLPKLQKLWLSDYKRGMDLISGSVDDRCSFEDGMWDGNMIASVAHVSFISLECRDATEARIIRMCSTAPRAISVRVQPVGWVDAELRQTVVVAAQRRLIELEIAQPL